MEKFRQNVQRDQDNVRALHSLDWRVLAVWECQTIDKNAPGIRLERFLNTGR
jgi:G:T-mismatch repair DNA endonuclease (very short patch repair protein)